MESFLLAEGEAFGLQYLFLAIAPFIFYFFMYRDSLHEGFPTAGLPPGGHRDLEKARERWLVDGPNILREGLKKFSGCFQVITTSGPKIILPGKFADEIRNDTRMDFGRAIHEEFFGSYPGFEAFAAGPQSQMLVEMVRGRLTQSLNFITADLADETAQATDHLLGAPKDWTECQFKSVLLQLAARVSSRVFVGPELCANQEWLDVSVNYTVHSMVAAEALTKWPSFLRPFVHWFLPEVRNLKSEGSRARQILKPVFAKRREENRVARDAGEKTTKVADTIGWLDEVAKGRAYDDGLAQLGLSFAAIHTTSELLSGIISDLCDHPQWFEPLREEMYLAIKTHGWSKKALQDMKLTDSMMKESQRHHLGDIAAMHRIASTTVELSDGTRIPKGAYTMVALDKMEDPVMFEDASGYHPRRFLDMRQKPGQEHKWQFVTTGPEHLAFGHGLHSCPGRFFASNEIKVILVYLLTKYEWKWATDGRKEDSFSGLFASADPTATAVIRARDCEISL
ncbi:Cytochrome P450 monooygenase 1 [Colletotrichum gloeosporioides]|uniref:Cytochrome P450 monooygenase 1 n=1 Tax=Colletotrichum gloeosporioides TaxID=474922 RepID=A0A8H4FRC7_COLGL|nr:Cytochrome P450 monooygenase 1 [Colletotrichum gloeosporioides]KAF3811758.1 Cytochrome P450 monooygenase 1 [Colletotrichum gloeosporioides]